MADVGKILIIPRGDYDPNATYYILDTVRYNHMVFMSRVNNLTNVAPPSTATSNANWMFLVADGGGATTLSSLADVDVVSAIDGQFLKYVDDGTNPPVWVPDDAAAALSELTDVDPTTTTTPIQNQILKYNGTKWAAAYGGSGHTMSPDPAINLSEDTIAETINAALGTNDEVGSLYSIQKWSNKKTFRVVYESTQAHPIGHTGIGEWQNILNEPTASDEATWGWWYHDIFKYLDNSDDLHSVANGYDVKLDFSFDPGNGEPITLGGYIVDTSTGYMCIKFANYVMDPSKAKIIVDITFTRNDISVM